MALVSLALATAFTVAMALILARFLRTGRPSLDLALLGFLWVFLVTLFLFIHGLAGALDPTTILVSSAAGLVVLGLIPAARRDLRRAGAGVGRGIRLVRAAWFAIPAWLRVVTGIVVALWSLRFLFLMWALPPFVWDSLTYHLTNVAHWVQAGRIEVFDTPVLRIYSPANYEVFAAWFIVFLRHDGWIEASGLPAYGITLVAVYATGRRLAFTKAAAWIAALGMASTPAVVLAATGTKNDPMVTAVFLLMLALVVDLALDVAQGAVREVSSRLLALALLVLYGFGTKTYILYLVPGLFVTGIMLAGWGRAMTFIRSLPRRLSSEMAASDRSARWLAVGLFMSGLVLGFFWYGRNEVLQGNPFFPYGVNLAGAQLEDAPGVTFRLDAATLWENLRLAAAKFGDKQARISPDLPNTTGWGWVAYGMGLPALVWAVIRRRDVRALAVGFIVCGLTLLLSSPTSPWNMRYMTWFPALLCLAVGAVFDALAWWRVATIGFAALLIGCLGLNFASTVNYNLVKVDQLRAMLARPFRDRQAAYLRVHVPYEYENALLNVPPDAVLGYNVHSNGFIYPLFRSDLSQKLAFIPIDPGESCRDIEASMRAAGTRYLVGAPEHTDDAVLSLLHRCGEEGSVLRELGVGLYVLQRDE